MSCRENVFSHFVSSSHYYSTKKKNIYTISCLARLPLRTSHDLSEKVSSRCNCIRLYDVVVVRVCWITDTHVRANKTNHMFNTTDGRKCRRHHRVQRTLLTRKLWQIIEQLSAPWQLLSQNRAHTEGRVRDCCVDLHGHIRRRRPHSQYNMNVCLCVCCDEFGTEYNETEEKSFTWCLHYPCYQQDFTFFLKFFPFTTANSNFRNILVNALNACCIFSWIIRLIGITKVILEYFYSNFFMTRALSQSSCDSCRVWRCWKRNLHQLFSESNNLFAFVLEILSQIAHSTVS